MRVTLSASMPTAKPQQLVKPQFGSLGHPQIAAFLTFHK